MAQALELKDLVFRYSGAPAVRGVSLSLEPGDCYGFLGHNGAGKTTVMRLCLGLLRPQRGTVRIFGIDSMRQPQQARATVGALVEHPGFHLHATAHQNLVWLAQLQGLPRRLAGAESARVLEQLGLAKAASSRVGTFSLGMRQRLGIAAALLGRPRLLLLDEPGNGLDPEGIADLRALLQQTRDEGVAVLLSSHQLPELEGLCNRIGVLREGAMVVEGSLDTLRGQLATRHVVAGTPLPAMERRLVELGLHPVRNGDRLLVPLGDRAPGAVARELTAIGQLAAFAPEPATLEAIYLRAAAVPSAAPTPAPSPPEPPAQAANHAPNAAGRAFGHELRVALHKRSAALLLLAPGIIAAWQVVAYRSQIRHSLERMRAGELFSTDAGSGHYAVALALQTATPALAVCLLWLASQSVSADLGGDTLRNTLMRSVSRGNVLFGKLAALAVMACAGWAALVLVAVASAATLLGWQDLEEVSRHGDHQVLAAAATVGPVFYLALRNCFWPLLALVALGLFGSLLAKRPARALATAVLLVLGPELLRDRLRDHAGWLLLSHLPTGLRDDSVLGFFAASARGAADAFWPWAGQAIAAPIAWFAAAAVSSAFLLRRLRIP